MVNSVPEGNGKMTFYNGNVYKGEFRNGKLIGLGVYQLHDGSRYEGNMLDGIKHGEGKMKLSNGG